MNDDENTLSVHWRDVINGKSGKAKPFGSHVLPLRVFQEDDTGLFRLTQLDRMLEQATTSLDQSSLIAWLAIKEMINDITEEHWQ